MLLFIAFQYINLFQDFFVVNIFIRFVVKAQNFQKGEKFFSIPLQLNYGEISVEKKEFTEVIDYLLIVLH